MNQETRLDISTVVAVVGWASKNVRWIEPILKSNPEEGWECESMKGFVFDGGDIFECLFKAWNCRDQV